MSADEQVCVIYAGVNGHLDKMPTSNITKFEVDFLNFMRNTHLDLMGEIKKTGVLTKEQHAKLGDILKEWLPQSGLLA
ncbi:MAG: hypothetical protein DHS20C13_30000 [Thermodesulfobacteriota bacterium]|nr:MAG: hypothetical protein DHS20C13_30000 [Thermodesulfobacteriota bacterium]